MDLRCNQLPRQRGALQACGVQRQRLAVQATVSTSPQTSSRKAVGIAPPYNVVITGSTKGVGRALAQRFLQEGDSVVITSRTGDRVEETVKELQNIYGASRVKGVPCDVAKPGNVKVLADFAKSEYGKIDIWINNAGTNAYRYGPLMDSDDDELASIVGTNVLGVMLGCKEAIRIMKDQPAGHIFNMDGAGADGNPTPRFAAYGATKRSLAQLGASLQAELSQAGIKHLAVHNLSPGMVTTELLMAGADTPTSKFFINCLAEEAQDVAEFLVPRIRKVPQESVNALTGSITPAYVKYLTPSKAYTQIFQRLVTGARKGRFVPES